MDQTRIGPLRRFFERVELRRLGPIDRLEPWCPNGKRVQLCARTTRDVAR